MIVGIGGYGGIELEEEVDGAFGWGL